MLLRKELELTEARVEYDHMLRQCNHLKGIERDLHRERMDELASKIQALRKEVDRLLQRMPDS